MENIEQKETELIQKFEDKTKKLLNDYNSDKITIEGL